MHWRSISRAGELSLHRFLSLAQSLVKATLASLSSFPCKLPLFINSFLPFACLFVPRSSLCHVDVTVKWFDATGSDVVILITPIRQAAHQQHHLSAFYGLLARSHHVAKTTCATHGVSLHTAVPETCFTCNMLNIPNSIMHGPAMHSKARAFSCAMETKQTAWYHCVYLPQSRLIMLTNVTMHMGSPTWMW